MKPDRAKASNLVLTTGIPAEPAATSLSRTAMRRRATPRSRQTRTMRTDRARTPSENQAKACSEDRLSPNSDGREMSVDSGLGSPEQMVRWIRGRVKQGVANTD